MQVYIRHDQPAAMAALVRKLTAKGIKVTVDTGVPAGPVDWWIEWGNGYWVRPPVAGRTLNVGSYSSPAASNDMAEKFLGLNRLRTFLSEDGTNWPVVVWPKEYQVYLWDAQVVAVQRKVVTTYSREFAGAKKTNVPRFQWLERLTAWERERLLPLAVRALHCLGLDFGKVRLGVNRSSGPVIIGFDPAPSLSPHLTQVYAEAIADSLAAWQLSPTVTIGSDPEFMLSLLPQKRMVPASRFFPRNGLVGCDNRRAFGASDDFPLAEVRPQPAPNPEAAVSELRQALKEASRLCPYTNIAWVAGSEPYPGYPIGGHIHFGGLKVSGQLIRALDQYVALPLLFLENPETARRRRQFYGLLGDFRLKPHGFEYRTPGSWLTSPELAWVALSLAALVARHYRRLSRWDFQRLRLQEAFYSGDLTVLTPTLETCLTELYTLERTEETAKLIKIIGQKQVEGEKSLETIDLRVAWGLPTGVHRYRQVARPRHSFAWIPGRAIRG